MTIKYSTVKQPTWNVPAPCSHPGTLQNEPMGSIDPSVYADKSKSKSVEQEVENAYLGCDNALWSIWRPTRTLSDLDTRKNDHIWSVLCGKLNMGIRPTQHVAPRVYEKWKVQHILSGILSGVLSGTYIIHITFQAPLCIAAASMLLISPSTMAMPRDISMAQPPPETVLIDYSDGCDDDPCTHPSTNNKDNPRWQHGTSR